MDYPVNERDWQLAEEFLQDLLLQTTSVSEMNLLIGILLEMQRFSTRPRRSENGLVMPQSNPQFEILKVCPDGAVSIGTIRGIEYAKRVLVCLKSTENAPYFLLFDKSARKVVESSDCSMNEGGEVTRFN